VIGYCRCMPDEQDTAEALDDDMVSGDDRDMAAEEGAIHLTEGAP
jgi:hypothetical protein